MEGDQRGTLWSPPGKLKAAVRHWLGGGVQDDTDEALAKFGLRREAHIDASDDPFRVFAINWPTLEIFWATWHQWRMSVVNNTLIRDGMDWMQVESALNLSGIKRSRWPMIFEGLRAIEENYLNPDKNE